MKRILTIMTWLLACAWIAQAEPNVKVVGGESTDAILKMYADQGDDTDDQWSIEAEANGDDLTINNGAVEVINVTTGGNVSVIGTFAATGAQTFTGNTTVRNLTVSTNASVGGTLLVTGVATLTATPVLNGTEGASGAVALTTTNGPTSSSTVATYLPVTHNGSNYWIAAWYKGS
jgi:hypothetical protein